MKKWKGGIRLGIVGILLALTGYVALIWLERQALKDLEQEKVVRCVKTCPAGENITSANVEEYFKIVEVAATLATEQTMDNLQQLIGGYPERTIEEGEIVYQSVFTNVDLIDNELYPVELSITAQIEYAVAGRIRKGDTVNVYVKNKETQKYKLVLENVVVREAFNSSAAVIGMEDEYALATMFTFYVDKTVEEELGYLYNSDIAIVKIR